MSSTLSLRSATFGAGALEPYDHALRDPARSLYVMRLESELEPVPVEVARFLAAADEDDRTALQDARGPIIDLGCGPGRLVRAAILGGHLALGIDASQTAVNIAQGQGLPVLHRSIFQELPAEGTWGTAMLIDGNIGIGGDPAALLRRCAELVLDRGRGRILVETHSDPDRDSTFDAVVVDDLERSSLPFAWAEVGANALRRYALLAGISLVKNWMVGQRTFVEYATA
ncbi:MAG: class I SAM-dependent methyltransferase [Rhodoglobus sp.]